MLGQGILRAGPQSPIIYTQFSTGTVSEPWFTFTTFPIHFLCYVCTAMYRLDSPFGMGVTEWISGEWLRFITVLQPILLIVLIYEFLCHLYKGWHQRQTGVSSRLVSSRLESLESLSLSLNLVKGFTFTTFPIHSVCYVCTAMYRQGSPFGIGVTKWNSGEWLRFITVLQPILLIVLIYVFLCYLYKGWHQRQTGVSSRISRESQSQSRSRRRACQSLSLGLDIVKGVKKSRLSLVGTHQFSAKSVQDRQRNCNRLQPFHSMTPIPKG